MLNIITSFLCPFSTSRSTQYKFAGQIYGHTDYIYSLAMSQDGCFLACGGELVFFELQDNMTYREQALVVSECGMLQPADWYKFQTTVQSSEVPYVVSSGLRVAKILSICYVLEPAWDIWLYGKWT